MWLSSKKVDFGGPVEGDDLKPVQRPTVFDAEPGRERVRGRVAGALVLLLSTLTLIALIAVVAGVAAADVRSIIELVLPPVVALCGSAIGFYFGSNSTAGR